MLRDIERTAKTLTTLTANKVAELCRRAGKPIETRRTAKGPRGKGSHSDPTYSTVASRMSGDTSGDVIYDSVKSVAHKLDEMANTARDIDSLIRFIDNEQNKESYVLYCEACQREVAGTVKDRLRSGYCGACYQAWLRAGKPYRTEFERTIQQKDSE